MSKEKILDKIFKYRLIKKDDYAELEKEVQLTIKERNDITETKNKMIKAKQERIVVLEKMLETKDNLFKNKLKKFHQNYMISR